MGYTPSQSGCVRFLRPTRESIGRQHRCLIWDSWGTHGPDRVDFHPSVTFSGATGITRHSTKFATLYYSVLRDFFLLTPLSSSTAFPTSASRPNAVRQRSPCSSWGAGIRFSRHTETSLHWNVGWSSALPTSSMVKIPLTFKNTKARHNIERYELNPP